MKEKISVAIMIIGIVVFFIAFSGYRHTMAKEEQDLLAIVSAVKSENIDINGWSLHAREKLEHASTMEEVKEYVLNLKENFSDWKWTVSSDSETWKATAAKVTSGKFQENIQILSTLTNNTPQTYIIYEIQGKHVNQNIEQFLRDELDSTLSDIFRENATIFSCIQGEFNDKMLTSVTVSNRMNQLMDAFHAKEIESLKEANFISTSAYSPLFAGSIKNNEKDMNLQLGIRSEGLGAKTTLVVGTPIITIEY